MSSPLPEPPAAADDSPRSLAPAAARQLSTTTKTVPQMRAITRRWLLRMLPWVEVSGGTYRVNRRLVHTVGDGRVTFTTAGAQVRVIPQELRELPVLRDVTDEEALTALADQFVQREYEPGEVIAAAGQPVEELFLVAHGKVTRVGVGAYGGATVLGVLADGDYFGDQALTDDPGEWAVTVRASTRCVLLSLSARALHTLNGYGDVVRAHVASALGGPRPAQNRYGEAAIALASGHDGEPPLPGAFVNYEPAPQEYPLSVAQTVLRVHTRVADLYGHPMDQVDQQVRLTAEALRERQEHDLVNNRGFGLLHNVAPRQRIHTRSGPPTPDDLDELLSRRRKSRFFLAHPRAIAAFGRECTRRGMYPSCVDVEGRPAMSWRGVPMLPCDKVPVSVDGTSSILVMRTGEDDAGVVGLHQTGLPDEYQPGLSVRFMGTSDQAVTSYLATAYYSVAVLVPDALGVLDNVEVGR